MINWQWGRKLVQTSNHGDNGHFSLGQLHSRKTLYRWSAILLAILLCSATLAGLEASRTVPKLSTKLATVQSNQQVPAQAEPVTDSSPSVTSTDNASSTTSSNATSSSSSTSVVVNGKPIQVPENGSFDQTTSTGSGSTSISVDHNSSSQSGQNNSSLNVDINSQSGGG
jgi:hypothetical protein